MLKTVVLVSYLFGLIHSGLGQIVFDGQCDVNVNAVDNFNATAYLGRWFLIESYPNQFQNGSCIDATYSLGEDRVDVFNTQVLNQALDTITGFAVVAGENNGTLLVTFPGSPGPSDYWILATDYISYALVYSCTNLSNQTYAVSSWKMSRTRNLAEGANNVFNPIIASIEGLDNTLYEPVDHSPEGCFYFPEPSPLTPVRFRARCDENISAVQNFNATRYLGLWNLIESYPSNFQRGSCITAQYTLGDEVVDVFNTQVINQTLNTMSGIAVVAATDDSGILRVSFPIAGTNETTSTPYYILATDYSSYALVYSCVEIDEEYIDVWSWKISRTKELPVQAVAVFNNITEGIQVLDEQYYYPVDQSPAGCFFFPEPQPGVPVEFPGLCDPTIDAVPDFNMTAFAGTWHEIESYPDLLFQGSCRSYEFELGPSDSMTVNVFEVNNQSMSSVLESGTLRLTSSFDPSGKLTFLFNVNGVILSRPFWVLDTDYTDYALVYSCMNMGQNSRQVFSWKFSRHQTLSVEAKTAISNVASSIDVIDDQYFEAVDRSRDACFIMPDLAPGEPAIFTGQCDPDIPVVQNFNASGYLGEWRLIESYASEFQRGGCLKANYALNDDDGSVIVLNSQVYNGDLQEITGRAVVSSTDGSARLAVTFPGNATATDLWVLATDYDSYSLAYSCSNINDRQKRVYAWKLSRSTSLSAEAIRAIDAVVDNTNVLNAQFFSRIDQSDAACFIYPDFDPLPDSIVLSGPCDSSIRGIPNFNASGYLGRWIEIEKYPQPFQTGECHRAEYSSGLNDVFVENTEVVNRILLTQTGSAVVASDDGAGELLVTFDVNGMINEANYYILATDYDNFALVYSCRNLSNGDRQVSSWKLSRTTTLSAQANSIIDSVIASTQGLRPAYYTVTNQSEEACFYIPEMNPDRPLRFRGSCPNVSGQPNFDMQRYLGWWHHMNNYPTGEDTGTCLSTRYEQADGSYLFEDTQVFGLTGQVIRGTVQATNNGLLSKTWNNGANSQDIWVLATDYTSYALVYACEPEDDGYVKVWSSMQSKSRSLSTAAQQAITAAIANNELLFSDFYLPVNQSDEACFHYPESTNRVVLPGQCDDSIPTQADFDMNGYSGTWYQMERYPYPEVSENSTCIGTRYTVNGNSVNVRNWEVMDEVLRVIDGQGNFTAGNAALDISLPVPGVENQLSTARLYILRTDYTSYSLAYTCENINTFERVVVAFKLSRSRTLTEEASALINSFMATREELHQPLFISVTQRDDCQEPNSAFLFRSSIFVVLLCYAINMLM